MRDVFFPWDPKNPMEIPWKKDVSHEIPFGSLGVGWVGWGERDSQNRSDWLGNHEAVRVRIEGPWCEGRCREGEGTAAGRMRRDVQEDRRRVQGEGR